MNNTKMVPVTRAAKVHKCRCCLQEGAHPLKIQDDSLIGMFRDTLNLLLSGDWRLPQWICLSCMNSLEKAKSFRDMVMAAERQLLQALETNACFVNALTNNSLQVTLCEKGEGSDVETDGDGEDEDSTFQPSDGVPSRDEESETTLSYKAMSYSDLVYTKITSWQTKNRPEQAEKSDSESDTLLPEKQKKTLIDTRTMVENVADDRKGYFDCSVSDSKKSVADKRTSKKLNKLEPTTPKRITIKHTVIVDNEDGSGRAVGFEGGSDNSKTRANILLFLKYSTIVPFRHHNHHINEYKCFYCDNTYQTMKELRLHTESEHVGKASDKTILSKISRKDTSINADVSCLKCRLCDEGMENLETLIEHLKELHKKIYQDTGKRSHGILIFDFSTEKLKCHMCDKHFNHFKELSSHMNDHCGDYICDVCAKKFISIAKYKTHIKRHEIKKRVCCDKCGASFTTKPSLINHIEQKHYFTFKGTLECERCSVTFGLMQYAMRAQHMSKVHGIKKRVYTCDVCQDEKNYEDKSKLYYHMSSVHAHALGKRNLSKRDNLNVKKFECDFCGKVFTTRSVFKFHVRIHTNDKRNKCTLCDAAFIQKHRLKSHYKSIHSDSGRGRKKQTAARGSVIQDKKE